MSKDIKLEDAKRICLAHGFIPLPKQSLQSITSVYDLMEAAMDGIIKLQSAFAAVMQGQSISQEAAKRNYDAIEEIKKFAAEKKPQYAAVEALLNALLEQPSGWAIGPLDHDAIFENDVWNVFNALGLGYEIQLISVSSGPTLWCIPPTNQYLDFYMDVETIEPLVESGLVKRTEIKDLPSEKREKIYYSTEAIFRISEKGKQLYSEIEFQASQAENKDLEAERILKTKINIKRH